MPSLIHVTFLGNSVVRWAIALVTTFVVIAALLLFRRLVVRRLSDAAEHTRTRLDDVVVHVLRSTRSAAIVAAGIAAGAQTLELGDRVGTWLGRALVVILALQVGSWVTQAISLLMDARDASARPGSATVRSGAKAFLRIATWVVLAILVLSNFGVEVGTLIAGLGIGGIAAALAVQNVLGDLFAALSIYLDRPCDIGDSIAVDAFQGTVTKIGWRSTQLRSITGEQIVLANSDLARSRIRNYGRMSERRVLFSFIVDFATPTEQLRRIPTMMREAIETLHDVRFERAHFIGVNEVGAQFEAVYFVLKSDFNEYANRQQELLLALHERFEREGISLLFVPRGPAKAVA